MKPSYARYVWSDPKGRGHNLYTMFRKTFDIKDPVKKANLNIFADTHYQLFINGRFIQYGPVRFDPRFPLYDTHDIASHLKIGHNVICVLVNSIQHKVFKTIPAGAGMAAWGEIVTDSEKIDLHTAKGTYKCLEAECYRPAPRLSFALNEAEFFDQSLSVEGWKEAEFNDSSWPDAVEVEDQNLWGDLSPRSIPLLKDTLVPIEKVKVYPIVQKEKSWSFSVRTAFMDSAVNEELEYYCPIFVWHTWIWSPKEQTIVAGVHEGDLWLNGQKIEGGVSTEKYGIRRNVILPLKEGWNFYFGKGQARNSLFQHIISLPQDKGLFISAEKDLESSCWFKRSPLLSTEEYDKLLKNKPLPYAENDTLSSCGGWVLTGPGDTGNSPFFDSCSDIYGDPIEELTPQEMAGHVFRKELYPDGFYIVLDLGQMRLVYPELKLSGSKGAVIDLVYSEKYNEDNRHLRMQPWVPLADRAFSSNNSMEWLLCHPRGFHYFGLTIRNASGDVKIDSLTMRSAAYPVNTVGTFKSSDQCLNNIWELGKRTQEANMEDAYVDCSGRERGMYGRDTIIQYHNNLALYGDQALMRRCLELFGQSPDSTGKFRAVYPNTGDYTISDFALNMLEGYDAYYEQTGDRGLIERYWNAMMKNLQWFHELADEREDLLLDSEWHLKRGIKAAYGGFHGDNAIVDGYMDITGIHCSFSCTYLVSLKSALKLSLAIGKTEDARELRRRIDILSESIPALFYDEEKGAFADNDKRTTYSVHASLMAVRAGVVKEEQLEGIKDFVAGELKSLFVNGYDPADGVYVSPHYSFYIFDGLYKLGLYETAENIMRQGWGWMLSQGLSTCCEFFSTEYSLCHAWAACPTYYLSKNVLGINFPDAPNLDRVEIDVKTSGITHAEGSWPHPRGVIEVKWHMEKGKIVFDKIAAPAGVEIYVK